MGQPIPPGRTSTSPTATSRPSSPVGQTRFGASIHPYRRDAVAELERCVKAGAVLCKWLPITQGFDPADPLCYPFYEALAHYRIPLLSHTGWEHVLPRIDPTVAAPARLVPALERGVTVIAAHSGTGAVPGEGSYLREFLRLAREHERLYGDTAGMNLPSRWRSYEALLTDNVAREKLVHGSDWPVPAFPRPWRHGWRESRHHARGEPNAAGHPDQARPGIRRGVLAPRGTGSGAEGGRRGRLALLRRAGKENCRK